MNVATAATPANVCSLEFDFARGCDGGGVRCWDVAQQVLLAQQPASHAIGRGVLIHMQDNAGNRTVAAKSATPTKTDMAFLLNIALLHNTIMVGGRISIGN